MGGYFFSIIYALIILIPLYFVIVSAFKNNTQIISTPLALPTALDFSKFIQAQNSRPPITCGVDFRRDHQWGRGGYPSPGISSRLRRCSHSNPLVYTRGVHFQPRVPHPWSCDLDADLHDDRKSWIALSSDRPGDPLPGFQPAMYR